MSTAVRLAVAGAHLSGQPLNWQLTDRGAQLAETTTTSAEYRLYALATEPPKPGVVRTAEEGSALEVEVWELSEQAFGSFVAALPQPMVIGTVKLASGEQVKGFLVEPIAVDDAEDITRFGGWRAYVQRG
ncbi:allophanate hydrolase-related protein [Nesterenkonia populi]